VVGKAEHLSQPAPLPAGHLAHAGTFNGHLTSCVAGAATLEHLGRQTIEHLNEQSQALRSRIVRAASEHGIDIRVHIAGSIMNVHPANEISQEYFYSNMHLSLILEGIYTAPRGMLNLSTVLNQDHLDHIANGYQRAFDRMAVDN